MIKRLKPGFRYLPQSLLIACAAMPMTSQAAGFVEDSTVKLTLRNYYMQRDWKDNSSFTNANKGMAEEWTQSFILDAKSGYTPGIVGFGVDAMGLLAIKLDGGRGTYGTQLLPQHTDGRPADDFGRLAVAAKAKFSKTELKVGEWMPVLPILRSDDGRAIPQTFRGAQITSKEITNVNLYAGQFRQNSPRNDGSMEDMFLNTGGNLSQGSDRFNFGGADYTFNNKHTTVAAWYGQLEDVYHQQYYNLTHTQPIGDSWVLGANVGYFIGSDDGDQLSGDLDSKTFSGLFSAKTGSHTFYVGLQKNTGDNAWMRVNGTSGGTLANDTFTSSYDSAQEKSWQVRYDYDFAGLGIPGLVVMNRYLKGTNVHNSVTDNGEEWGRDTEIAYTLQSGPFKSLSLKWRNATLRRDWTAQNASWNENRVIIQYPLSIL